MDVAKNLKKNENLEVIGNKYKWGANPNQLMQPPIETVDDEIMAQKYSKMGSTGQTDKKWVTGMNFMREVEQQFQEQQNLDREAINCRSKQFLERSEEKTKKK